MKNLILIVLATLTLTACNTSSHIDLEYQHTDSIEQDTPHPSDVQQCNDVGGEYEVILVNNVAKYECTFYNPCVNLDCTDGKACPIACK